MPNVETWLVLEDGTAVDPNECASDESGALVHKSGARVAMRFADCPMSRSVDPDAERESAKKKPAGREMKTGGEKKPGYETRESKAN